MKTLLLLICSGVFFSSLAREEIHTLKTGSGNYSLSLGRDNRHIQIYYHKPTSFTSNSPILIVIPGAGRNADDYRDAWVQASKKHNILILSPSYPENLYDFGKYHMGGTMDKFSMISPPIVEQRRGGRIIAMRDENIAYSPLKDSSKWIFPDFDSIFIHAKTATASERENYDIFGHSAGGQILHRLALFYPKTQANAILASNSGFYTLPNPEERLPFGTREFDFNKSHFEESFQKNLILFIGEEDDHEESKGTLLKTPKADQQGPGRKERARYFFEYSEALANQMEVDFNWKLEIIKDIGHEYRKMGEAAASYLYSHNKSKQ